MSGRVAQVNDERVEVVGEASGGRAEAALLELVDQCLQSLLGVAFVDRVIQRLPVGLADAIALGLGQLGQQVAHPVHRAVLAVGVRPALLDGLDQPGGAVGNDQHRRAQAAGDQIAAERLPVLIGLAHPQHHRQQHAFAGVGEPPGDQHALLGPARSHGQEGRVEEQRDEPDLVEIAALERRKAFAQLLAHPGRAGLGHAAQPGLLAERLDVAHRQAAHERADHQRLQRLGPQQLAAPREQPRDERRGGLADLRDLDLKLALGRLQRPRAKPVAHAGLDIGPALVAGPAQPRVELLLDRALDDQPRAELGQLRQRSARVLPNADGQQLVDLSFDLRRRRYGTSHGVGLLHRLPGLEGTYAVASTAPALFPAALRRDRAADGALALALKRPRHAG